MNPPRVKVCCISSIEEARIAVSAGASALGLVGRMPSGPGIIDDARIREIASSVPPVVGTFLLTEETDPDAVIAHHRRTSTNALQLVDYPDASAYQKIRAALPYIKIVQVLHVEDDSCLDLARRIGPYVDAILLDSGNTKAKTKELGGTGRTHDWSLSRRLVQQATKPVFLAGGLNPENVASAIGAVQPFGVDLCSGIRTDGKLDEEKLSRFMTAVKNGSS